MDDIYLPQILQVKVHHNFFSFLGVFFFIAYALLFFFKTWQESSFCPNIHSFIVKSIGPGILLVTGSGLRAVLCSKLVQLDWRETYITKMGGWVFSLACSLKVNLWLPGEQILGSHKNKDQDQWSKDSYTLENWSCFWRILTQLHLWTMGQEHLWIF